MPVTDIQHSQQVASAHLDAQHYVNSPAHATALLEQAVGELRALQRAQQDDPVLYAYAARDSLRRTLPLLNKAMGWCNAVIVATPDQVPTTGAVLPTLKD